MIRMSTPALHEERLDKMGVVQGVEVSFEYSRFSLARFCGHQAG
jgi:hypothetical protein